MVYRAPPKKRYGQHFLVSAYYARRIAEAIDASASDPVLEIGPGRGALSVFLKERFPRFHCVELDREVVPVLRQRVGDGDWTLHVANALDLDFTAAGTPVHVAGNLPYNVGAHIIRKTLMYGTAVASCTFMVQREVAERIVARPGSGSNGFLSVFCQFFGSPRILFHVPPGAFHPKPRVTSSVFRMVVDSDAEARLARDLWESFFAFVDKGYSMRRKMLVNTLGRDGDKERFRELIRRAGLPPAVRPEELSVDEWLALYRGASLP